MLVNVTTNTTRRRFGNVPIDRASKLVDDSAIDELPSEISAELFAG
jgi:hypothetical protein